ncbi:MAG: DUF1997 domain-containing protein [Cyanobacteria bacterium J06639_1]
MSYQFHARQTATVRLSGGRESVRAFLAEPERTIAALLQRDRVRQLDAHQFEVSMKPIGALGTSIHPIVTLDIHSTADGCLLLKALDCRIEGNAWVDRHFNLWFQGELAPARVFTEGTREISILAGVADLHVTIELPPLLRLTPAPVVQRVGTTITQGVLGTIQRSLSKRLPEHFAAWAASYRDQALRQADGEAQDRTRSRAPLSRRTQLRS